MAVPTMTNNSPSAGYIAWGSFTIQYQGISYVVSAGSSNQRWVWWRYNAGSPVIEAGADIPTTLTDDDLVLFGNKNGISLRVQSTQVLDGELIVDGSIFADAIAANQIVTTHISTLGLDAAVVKFGTMSGDRIQVGTLDGNVIKANTILSSQLIVTDFENNLDNPKGLIGTVGAAAAGWGVPTSTTTPLIASAVLPDGSTGQVLQITANGTTLESLNKPVTVSAGDEFWISGYVRKVSGTDVAGTLSVLANTTTLTDGTTSTASATASAVSIAGLTTAWTLITGSIVMPAKAAQTSFRIAVRADVSDGVYQFYDLQARRKNNGNLIVDGSITSTDIITTGLDAAVIKFGTMSGDRIVAQTINSNHVVTAGLDASVVKFGAMHGDRITVNTLNGDRILVNSLVAAQIIVGDVANLVRDPSADNNGASTLGAGWSILTVGAPTSPNDDNSAVFRYTANNAYSQMAEPRFPVQPGDQYALSYYIRTQNTLTGSCSIAPLVFFYNQAGTYIGTGGIDSSSASLTGTWTKKSAQFTVPALAASAQILTRATAGLTAGLIDVDQITLLRQVTSTVIEPNLLLSSRIVAGAALTGARVELNTVGLQAYNASSVLTTQVESATGNVSIRGAFGTGDPAGAGIRISSQTFAGIYGQSTYPTIVFNNGSQAVVGNRQPQIFTDTVGNTNLYIWGGAGASSRMPQVKLDVGLIRIGFENAVGSNEIDGTRIQLQTTDQIDFIGAIVKTWGEHQVTGAVQCNGSLQTSAAAFQMTTAGGATWKGLNAGDVNVNGTLAVTASGSFGNNLSFNGPTTGSFTANVNWNSSTGGLRVNTSSRRFKENIRDADVDVLQALKLTPRKFERNDGEPEDAGKTYVGFVAEEAADLGLTDWVVYDEEGPWSFGYDQWVVALQAIARQQNTEIVDLKAKVSDQDARLEALERKLEEITS